ncbi:SIR2 family protein [Aliarcobacter butzleri]|uniref:P-loop NTPase n=1 Tax=Aliarcobacter butzleri TaxID=28197 RepID=UPI0021B2A9C0|nr:SIR2 family protein [Aliarcobacter butzleri]MCT7581232.1 SIR2 family protein [Aliarcobacter butzleri]
MAITIEREGLLKNHLREEGINLFLGAGFSYNAMNKNNDELPTGDSLKKLLVEKFDLQMFEQLSLPQISDIIKKQWKGDFNRYLRDLYSVKRYDEKYNCINKLNIKNIFTLNIDDLVEKIYEDDKSIKILYDVEKYGSIDNEGIDFFKLHGSITYTHDKELLFSPEELSNLFLKDITKSAGIALKIASKATIFWGTRIEDANILNLLSDQALKKITPKEKWVLVTPSEKNDAIAKFFKIQGYNIIRGNTEELLDYIKKFLEENHVNDSEISNSNEEFDLLDKHFSNNLIHKILSNQYPSRPLKSFFSGDDPVWSDILDRKIPTISYYNEILGKIHKNKKTFITGGIGSGKSTILMQLAIDPLIDGIKLFFNNITLAQAIKLNVLIKHLKKSIYIFIDNISNNLEAFLYLEKQSIYNIICAERDFNLDTILHKCDLKKDLITDITVIKDIDIQKICDLAHTGRFKSYSKMSLFEVAYYIWEGKKLKDKILDLINHLENNETDQDIFEFFTLMTYVRSCGISASMDMLLLYYQNDNITYKDIYTIKNKLSSLIDENDHFSISEEQDYFTLRSTAFAAIALRQIPSDILSKVLHKFSFNVHKDIIVRYNTFKRKAFDADIVTKAFRDIRDGIEFFERIIAMDPSEYRYQQFSLYLYRKGDLKKSWECIEEAILINPSSWTIKNTHAYILFKKNINVHIEEAIVKETLDETFRVIENCIQKDIRSSFHIITFCENSIEYYERFIDNPEYFDDIFSLIEKSKNYINEELKDNIYITSKNKSKLKKFKSRINEIFERISKNLSN